MKGLNELNTNECAISVCMGDDVVYGGNIINTIDDDMR
jgi:hypothetical protein